MSYFVKDNQLPIIKKFDINYLTKLERSDKILILTVLNTKDINHIGFLESFFHNMALQRREYVFSYIDNSEKFILDYFKLPVENSVRVMIYNFKLGKFYLDHYRYSKDNESFERLYEVIRELDNDRLNMSSGYIMEDTLTKLGISVRREVIIIGFFFVLAIMLSFILIIACQYIEKRKDKLKLN
jgi:hypothetical protein